MHVGTSAVKEKKLNILLQEPWTENEKIKLSFYKFSFQVEN